MLRATQALAEACIWQEKCAGRGADGVQSDSLTAHLGQASALRLCVNRANFCSRGDWLRRCLSHVCRLWLPARHDERGTFSQIKRGSMAAAMQPALSFVTSLVKRATGFGAADGSAGSSEIATSQRLSFQS